MHVSIEKLYAICLGLLVVGGAVCYMLRGRGARIAGPLAAVCALGALVVGVGVWMMGRGMAEASLDYGVISIWRPFAESDVGGVALLFAVTPLTGLVHTLCLVFGFCVVLYSVSYWEAGGGDGRPFACMLWAVAGASIALLTRNLLVFVFAWEIVTVMLYLLVSAGGERARAGAAKTFAMLGFSDVALILGVCLLVARGGWQMLSIDHLQDASRLGGRIAVVTWGDAGLYLLFLIAALAKAGAVPLHTWIPAAAEAAPIPAMALLPASLDKLLGITLLVRISYGFFELSYTLKLLLMVVGLVTILSAVMMAMVQHDLRKLLSFHAVSQVGYMVLGIGTGTPIGIVGGVFHMVNHAIYKSLLFLSSGAVEKRVGDLDLDRLGGLARSMPMTALAFVIGALAISGVPPLNGFVSKWMIYQGVIEGGGALMPILLAGAVLGSGLTLASFVKAMHSVFFGDEAPELFGRDVREAGWSMLFPFGLLSAACVLLGVGGGFVARRLMVALAGELNMPADGLTAGASITSNIGFFGPVSAVVLIAVGLALGLVFYGFGRALRVRRVRPFIAGELETPAPTHVSGTSFYLTVREMPVLRGFYRDAEHESFDVYRVAGMLGSVVVQFLRRLHTGVLEVYVTWVVAGVAAVVFLLLLLR